MGGGFARKIQGYGRAPRDETEGGSTKVLLASSNERCSYYGIHTGLHVAYYVACDLCCGRAGGCGIRTRMYYAHGREASDTNRGWTWAVLDPNLRYGGGFGGGGGGGGGGVCAQFGGMAKGERQCTDGRTQNCKGVKVHSCQWATFATGASPRAELTKDFSVAVWEVDYQ